VYGVKDMGERQDKRSAKIAVARNYNGRLQPEEILYKLVRLYFREGNNNHNLQM
jgi:hypothetical protein